MSCEARSLGLATTLLATLASQAVAQADARAEERAHAATGITLDVVGACPDTGTVRHLLEEVLSADEARAATISIADQGPHYRIAVRSVATTLDDPARDCADRARQAAVVAANELRSHPPVLGPPVWTVEKGVVFDVAPGHSGGVWAAGAEIRGAYGSRPWSLVGAAGARGPARLSFEQGWQADLLRFPLDAGARLTMHRWRLRPWLVVGGSLTVTGILGLNLVQTDRRWRVDPGGLAMVGATLPVFGRVGGALALAVRWQPRPYQLQVVPIGTVGDTPVWWIGLSLNYTLDGKPSSP